MTPPARELRLRRAAAQLLHRPSGLAPAELVGSLLAVQSQDLRAARLALRARTTGLTARDVDGALRERSIVAGWLMRGTLHIVRPDDYRWLLSLTAPTRFATSRRRLGQEGVPPGDADRAVDAIERSLVDEGPLTRPELEERIAGRSIRTEGQATPHLLMLAALRGVALLGPVRDRGQAFVLARDWLGEETSPPDRHAALAELARRYLRGHGPATEADLAAWSGLPLRDARAGLAAIASELDDRGGGLVDLARRAKPPAQIAPRLLPAFDPYLLGWKDRAFAVPSEHARKIHPGGGMLRAVATEDGVAVGTWKRRPKVEIEPFGGLSPETEKALRADAEDVARFESR